MEDSCKIIKLGKQVHN